MESVFQAGAAHCLAMFAEEVPVDAYILMYTLMAAEDMAGKGSPEAADWLAKVNPTVLAEALNHLDYGPSEGPDPAVPLLLAFNPMGINILPGVDIPVFESDMGWLPPAEDEEGRLIRAGLIARHGKAAEVQTVRAWAKTLGPETVKDLEMWIEVTLSTLESDVEQGCPAWILCDKRDDLESMAAVLSLAQMGCLVHRHIRLLDDEVGPMNPAPTDKLLEASKEFRDVAPWWGAVK